MAKRKTNAGQAHLQPREVAKETPLPEVSDLTDGLPADPYIALMRVCSSFCNLFRRCGTYGAQTREYALCLEYYALALVLLEQIDDIKVAGIQIGTESAANLAQMNKFLRGLYDVVAQRRSERHLETAKAAFRLRLGQGFSYELTDGDIARIQTLINELRGEIQNSKGIEADHKARLLRRLEKLQTELNKRMSNLDQFWALLGEAGIALGKFGEDAKPFFDRVREILQIVWSAQTRAEQLPSNSPLPQIGADGEATKLLT